METQQQPGPGPGGYSDDPRVLTPGHVAANLNRGGLLFFENFEFRDKKEWMSGNWTMSIWIIVFYLSAIFLGQWVMKGRKPFQLRGALTSWNITLALFSIAATVRTLPELIRILVQPRGFHHSVCSPW